MKNKVYLSVVVLLTALSIPLTAFSRPFDGHWPGSNRCKQESTGDTGHVELNLKQDRITNIFSFKQINTENYERLFSWFEKSLGVKSKVKCVKISGTSGSLHGSSGPGRVICRQKLEYEKLNPYEYFSLSSETNINSYKIKEGDTDWEILSNEIKLSNTDLRVSITDNGILNKNLPLGVNVSTGISGINPQGPQSNLRRFYFPEELSKLIKSNFNQGKEFQTRWYEQDGFSKDENNVNYLFECNRLCRLATYLPKGCLGRTKTVMAY